MKLVGKGRIQAVQISITLSGANGHIGPDEWQHWFNRRLEIYAVYEYLARSMAFPNSWESQWGAPPLTFRVF